MDFIEIEILNWGKHQPRKDIKHPTWFSVSNRIMEDSKIFGLEDVEWKALLYFFCQASQQNSGNVKINLAHALKICGLSKKAIISTADKLANAGVTSAIRGRTDALRDTTLQDTTEQNTTRHDIAPKKAANAAATPSARADEFIAAYCERFKARWGVNPQIQGKDAGILKRLAKGIGLDRFRFLLDAYFSMPDAQVVKWKHPINIFEMKLNEITVFADSGNFTTQTQVRQADSTATNALLLKKIREGKA